VKTRRKEKGESWVEVKSKKAKGKSKEELVS
jgi:hypothetical protein